MTAQSRIVGYTLVVRPTVRGVIEPGSGRFSQEGPVPMRGHRWLAAIVVGMVAATTAGCQGTGSKRTAAAPEPSLSGALDSGGTLAESRPAKTITYVDRHPLFSKPREYWDSSGDNKIVKAAAATFVGVPVGLFGEVKQIVVGTPPETR
jgi:hypothetical protein